MSPYKNLTDQQLLDKIAQFQAAYEELALGDGIAVIAGEGRRLEYTKRDGRAISNILRECYAEAQSRGLSGYDSRGGAIPVRIG